MDWHISMAKYNKTANAVAEHRVKDFGSYEAGIDYLNKHQDKAIYLWHTNAANLENPMFAMVETDNYKKEYHKIHD